MTISYNCKIKTKLNFHTKKDPQLIKSNCLVLSQNTTYHRIINYKYLSFFHVENCKPYDKIFFSFIDIFMLV